MPSLIVISSKMDFKVNNHFAANQMGNFDY